MPDVQPHLNSNIAFEVVFEPGLRRVCLLFQMLVRLWRDFRICMLHLIRNSLINTGLYNVLNGKYNQDPKI
jgi:hypothetical protein